MMDRKAYFRQYRMRNREKLNAQVRMLVAKNRERFRIKNRAAYRKAKAKGFDFRGKALRLNWGLSWEGYSKILASQKGRCAICSSSDPKGRGRFHVDHNHMTGKIRGLLCTSCNLILGHSNDNPSVLFSAVEYLHKHSSIESISLNFREDNIKGIS